MRVLALAISWRDVKTSFTAFWDLGNVRLIAESQPETVQRYFRK